MGVAKARRVGILRIGSIGDHVIAMPLYRLLRARHQQDSLVLISNVPAAGNDKLVGPAGILPPDLFDEIQAYPALSGWRNVAAIIGLFRRLRLDTLYYLMPRRTQSQRRRDSMALRLLVSEVVGLSPAATEPPRPDGDAGMYEHEADRLARLLGLGGADRAPAALSLGLTGQERLSIGPEAVHRSGAVVVSVGTKCEVNHWGNRNWRELVRKIGALDQLQHLFLVGSADEHAECEELRSAWPREATNFCGKLSPRQSAALMSASSLFVGHDSGPMHLASAVGVPIVAIFSSRNLPGTWYPLSAGNRTHYTVIDCMGCGLERCAERNKACITAITVEEVYESCRAMLANQCLERAG